MLWSETLVDQLIDEATAREGHEAKVGLGLLHSLLVPIGAAVVRSINRFLMAVLFIFELLDKSGVRERHSLEIGKCGTQRVLFSLGGNAFEYRVYSEVGSDVRSRYTPALKGIAIFCGIAFN